MNDLAIDELKINTAISHALYGYLANTLEAKQNSRRFFRLDGFDDIIYVSFLHQLMMVKNNINGVNLEVRTTSIVEGFEIYLIEDRKSATWYRNNVSSEETLILIFNERTSDAQSLKDIFPITERFLSTEGQDHLIQATFTYALNPEQHKKIKEFISRFSRHIIQPQLRYLVAFLLATDSYLIKHSGSTIEKAISDSLPYLDLFKSGTLAEYLNTSKGDRLLGVNYKAARIGLDNLDDSDRNKYLALLENADFEDEKEFGGLSKSEKENLLRRFLTDVISDYEERRQILHIDWDEVSSILYKKKAQSKVEQNKELASEISTSLEEQRFTSENFSELFNEALEDLDKGREPDKTGLDELITELDDLLDGKTKRILNKLKALPKFNTDDFLSGILHVTVDLVTYLKESPKHLGLTVTFNGLKTVGESELEAINTFHKLYGGIESIMPFVTWELDPLWQHLQVLPFDDEKLEEDNLRKVTLPFIVAITGAESVKAELNWDYRSDGTAAATNEHLKVENSNIGDDKNLYIPIYNSFPENTDISALDLSRPVMSLSAWYRNSSNLRKVLESEFREKTDDDTWIKIDSDLQKLERSWERVVKTSYEKGLFSADIYGLLDAYESFLKTCDQVILTGQEILYSSRVLTQAWMIGSETFDQWAVMPLLHPLKLHWWIERAQHFNKYLTRLGEENHFTVADTKRFQNELETVFDSAGYPAIVALPGINRTPEYFLSVLEYDGYELYRRVDQAALAYGLAVDYSSAEEVKRSASGAAKELAKVIRDYIETYPFVTDGLEVYIVQCRNSSLPGLLVQHLDALAKKREWNVNLNIIVHTETKGTPLYQRINDWLGENEEYIHKQTDSFFPRVSLKILQSGFDELYNQVDDTDIVILPDVLAEKGLKVEAFEKPVVTKINRGYLPLYTSWQDPHTSKEMVRNIFLTNEGESSLVSQFHKLQAVAVKQEAITNDVVFMARTSLRDWEDLLLNLHKRFNWVVCYDTTVDRFLLEATVPESAEVIRYSVGLGPRRQHNLTVSASDKAQKIVVNRLASRLEKILPGTPDYFRNEVANKLVQEAKIISGDLVLRAAGPGAFLNELIGVVSSKHCTELNSENKENSLTAWIYLDDFAHWFERGKFPDLLFVTLTWDDNKSLQINAKVIEAKCVDEGSVTVESADAIKQIVQGVKRLKRTLSPDTDHLDKPFWINQFYQALVGNLSLSRKQLKLWENLKKPLQEGDFSLNISGHAWVFSYGQNAGLDYGQSKEHKPIDSKEMLDLHQNLYNRKGLRQVFKTLVEDWQLSAPENTWTEQHDIFDSSHNLTPDSSNKVKPNEKVSVAHESSSETSNQIDAIIVETDKTKRESVLFKSTSEELFWLQTQAKELERALRDYGLQLFPIDPELADIGPNIVRYKILLRPGEQLSKVQRIAPDLVHRLALKSVPLIDNVLGTTYVGIDLPSQDSSIIELLPLLESFDLPPSIGSLKFVVGQTPDGQTLIEDLSEFPHLLVAGATNSGKSVFLRSLLLCLMEQYSSDDLKLLIVDPKRTDFSFFNNIPYLIGEKVITDKEEARALLLNLVQEEMVNRQKIMSGRSLRIKDFNQRFPNEALPLIVAVIDEYAQLVSVMSKRERDTFEQDLMSLAAVARSTGIHLILATQRPSADVVTGTLKANLPAGVAFKVASAVNSRIVIDQAGAENLLGKGDLLFRKPSGEVIRLQAPFIDEVTLQEYMNKFRN